MLNFLSTRHDGSEELKMSPTMVQINLNLCRLCVCEHILLGLCSIFFISSQIYYDVVHHRHNLHDCIQCHFHITSSTSTYKIMSHVTRMEGKLWIIFSNINKLYVFATFKSVKKCQILNKVSRLNESKETSFERTWIFSISLPLKCERKTEDLNKIDSLLLSIAEREKKRSK